MCFFISPAPSGMSMRSAKRVELFQGLCKDERQDGWEFRGAEIVAKIVVPDADHVGQQAKANERVFLILVLEEDVEEGGLTIDFRGKEKVARGGGELGVDEAAADKGQRAPIDAAGEFAREMAFQKGPGVVGVREGRFNELVVGLVDRGLAKRHGGRIR